MDNTKKGKVQQRTLPFILLYLQ